MRAVLLRARSGTCKINPEAAWEVDGAQTLVDFTFHRISLSFSWGGFETRPLNPPLRSFLSDGEEPSYLAVLCGGKQQVRPRHFGGRLLERECFWAGGTCTIARKVMSFFQP